jgi:hypothetical protein
MLFAMFGNSSQTAVLAVAATVFYAAIGALLGFAVYMVRKRNRSSSRK